MSVDTCTQNKVDSNVVGLRYAKETCPGVLPDNPVWTQVEYNEMSKFSPELSYEQRNPITQSRQNQIGAVVDVTSGVTFTQDYTINNCTDLLQGFFFAAAREKFTSKPLNEAAKAVTVPTADNVVIASVTENVLSAGDLLLCDGFANTKNNKIVSVVSSEIDAGNLSVTVADSSFVGAPVNDTTAAVTKVGIATNCSVKVVGDLVELSFDGAESQGLIVGEWIYVGGRSAATRFANNGGFARVFEISTGKLTVDKVWSNPADEAAKNIEIYFGTVIKNESDPELIKRFSYQFERTLGIYKGVDQLEYNVGAVANEFKLTVPTAGKVTTDMTFVSMRNEAKKGNPKTGLRPALHTDKTLVNTSVNFAQMNMSVLAPHSVIPTGSLFNYATDFEISIANGVEANKAIGVIGAFDTSMGNFDVTGSVTAYFTNVDVIEALIQSRQVTFDCAMVVNNKATVWDVPVVTLGGGELAIEQNQPIKIPVDLNAAESYTGYTLMYVSFPFVPQD